MRRQKKHKVTRGNQQQPDVNDPVERLIEWQEHRYDAGYYTGGNIHPLFTASRPNKYGYVLIAGAIMVTIVLVLGIRADVMDWYSVTVTAAFVIFSLVVGIKLIKKPPTLRARRRRRLFERDH